MKKSEFLNKIKEELKVALDEISYYEYKDDTAEVVQLVKTLLTNDALLKMSANSRNGREQLCVLAETVKGLANAIRRIERVEAGRVTGEGLTIDELETLTNTAKDVGTKKAARLEENFEDDMEDIKIGSDELLDRLLDGVAEQYGLDNNDIAKIKEEIKSESPDLDENLFNLITNNTEQYDKKLAEIFDNE